MFGGAILFADEFGLDLARACLPEHGWLASVIDPNRPAAHRWASDNGGGGLVLDHPIKNDRENFLRDLDALDPAVGVIVSYGRILWPELIGMFPNGVANLHFGKLPEYRGANILQWAIIDGAKETAATLHYVDQGIDTGPVIDVTPMPIEDNDTALSLRRKLSFVGKEMLKVWLPKLLKNRVPAIEQDESRANFWPRRTEADGQIDWSWSDERIRNLTRALVPPWPGAFYIDRMGKKQIVDRAITLNEVKELRREVQS